MNEPKESVVGLIWWQRGIILMLALTCLVLHRMQADERADAQKTRYINGWLEEQLEEQRNERCPCRPQCECVAPQPDVGALPL